MIQTIAKFLLIIFYYPFLPMRDPGTSYYPTVWAERERKSSNSFVWVMGWFFGVVSLATYFKGADAGGFAFLAIITFLFFAVDWKMGLVVAGLFFLVMPWNLVLVPIIFFLGWSIAKVGLEILAMDPWEWDQIAWKEKERKKKEDALLNLLNRNRQ